MNPHPTPVDAFIVALWGFAFGIALWASGLDIALQGWLFANYNQTFNDKMRFLSQLSLGRTQIWALLLVGVGVMAWHHGLSSLGRLARATVGQFGFWLRGKRGWVAAWVGIPLISRLCCTALGVVAVNGLLQILSKIVVGRPRPKEWLWNGHNPYTWQPFGFDAGFWSLPSGHASSTFAIFVWLALGLPKWRVPLLGAAFVLACSRFLAVTPHYLGDVVAGIGLGSAVAMWLWGRTYAK